MASLERMNFDGRDGWRLRLYINKKRETIGLRVTDESDAELAKSHIEHLIEMRSRNRPPKPVTSRWLESIPAEVYDRLANLLLVEPRAIREQPRTTLAFMRAYIASRTDWKKPENYKQAVDHLETFLKRDLPLAGLTKGDVDRWHRWMVNDISLSTNTAGQNVKRCRQMMRSALDDGLIESNPFLGVKIDLSSDETKNRFIDGKKAMAILESCPDQEWRTIFALARFGGMRCPSEVLALRWSDIVWDRGRFIVRSSKTARYGKGERVVPLFPELLTELQSLYDLVQPGVAIPLDSYVIKTYRSTETNLRKALHTIADNAGVERWPKPFMALRASRRTELERSGKFANHVLNDWFGHSGAIAETHYLQTTEDDFGLAVRSVGTFVGPSVGNHAHPRAIGKIKKPRKSKVMIAAERLLMAMLIHPIGFEPITLGSEDRCAIQLRHGCSQFVSFYRRLTGP